MVKRYDSAIILMDSFLTLRLAALEDSGDGISVIKWKIWDSLGS